MPIEFPRRTAAIGISALAGIMALWWTFAPDRGVDSPVPASRTATPGGGTSGRPEEAGKNSPSVLRVGPKILADLIRTHRSRDQAAEEQCFSKLQEQLLHAGTKDASLVGAVLDLIQDGNVETGLRLGLVQALIQGASSMVIPRIVDLFHSTNDPEIKRAILQKLPDIQGDARMIDQGVNVTPALVAAFSGESEDSPLLVPLAVALTKMGDAKAVGFLIDQVASRAATVDKIEASRDVRLIAAVSALTDNAIPTDSAVPYLVDRLAASLGSTVEAHMTVMALASIGSTEAITGLMAYFESAPDSQAGLASSALSRLTHPDTLDLLQTSLEKNRFKSVPVKGAVNEVAADLKE